MIKVRYIGFLDHFPQSRRSKIISNFEAKIQKSDDDQCWNWLGGKHPTGYGMFTVRIDSQGTKTTRAHRLSYEIYNGKFDLGLTVDHLCGNKSCVNPRHLEAVTSAENTRRCVYAPATINAGKLFCKHGHPFDVDNTYIYPPTSPRAGQRKCRTCERIRARQLS